MSVDRWQALDNLFHEAIGRPPAERDAFLTDACRDDEMLRQDVERLLRAHDAAGGFLGVAAADRAIDALTAPEASVVGALVGPYRIVREIGRGGMGAVYLAERADDQFHKHVAVKLVKRGLDTDAVLRRFRSEREILAGLDHPNIARLLDAGTTADARPYVLMEYVDGRTIDRYSIEEQLTVDRRLELFLRVCAAVAYAHQRLVVHRDIKPSNILVTADGTPKLLDFGIAKMIDESGSTDTVATAALARPMTPEYASPEQVQGLASTTLGDVYSLGVLLYELLAGRPPFRFETRTPEAIARVTAIDPTRPSDVVAAGEARRRLQGDLDTIVLTAMSRDRERRYPSVERFADDIRRHMTGQPIVARRDAPMYRARKFVRRNRVAVGAALAIVAALVGGLATTTFEAIRAGRAERAARRDRDRATAITDFLQNDLLSQASSQAQGGPGVRPDPNLTVRAALDRAAARVNGKFADPEVEASIRETIGRTYRDVTAYADAETQLKRALELRRQSPGPTHAETLRTERELGVLYFWQGKYADAAGTLTNVLAEQRRVLGDTDADTLATTHALGNAVSGLGRHREAEAMYRSALAGDRRALGLDHPETLQAMNDLIVEYTNQGKYVEAAELGVELVARKRRVFGAEHPSTLLAMNNLGVAYRNLGKYSEAEALFTTCLDARRRVVGADHVDTLASLNSLALVYQAESKYAQAEPLMLEGLAARRRVLGEEHPQTVALMNNLAELYRREGRQRDAESMFRRVVELRRRVLGPDHPNTAHSLTSLARITLDQGQYAEAQTLLRAALYAYKKNGGDTWQRYYAESLLARSLADTGRQAEGRDLVDAAYRALLERRSSIPFENQSILDDVKSWSERLHDE
jgi:tetratricopeptide (TPR) repeat protein/tRNA A-37 threonylcarbamoyl transferase component Bud32